LEFGSARPVVALLGLEWEGIGRAKLPSAPQASPGAAGCAAVSFSHAEKHYLLVGHRLVPCRGADGDWDGPGIYFTLAVLLPFVPLFALAPLRERRPLNIRAFHILDGRAASPSLFVGSGARTRAFVQV